MPPELQAPSLPGLRPIKVIDPSFPAWADLPGPYIGFKGRSDLPTPHLHGEFEIGVIHRGRATFMIAEKHLDFVEGDVCVIGSPEPHRAFYPVECLCTWMYFDIPRLLSHSALEIASTRVESFQGSGFVNVFRGKDYPALWSLALDMIQEFGHHGVYFRDSLRSLLMVFLVRLHRLEHDGDPHFSGVGAGQKIARGMIAPISPAIEYMHQHFGDRIDMDELAARTCMSPSNFRRTFNKCLGCSPHEYLISHRVAAAQTLLQEGGRSVSQVALECGFTEPSSFRRAFRKRTGQTPVSVRVAGRK